eukprot:6461887-Amphidinium_carterae.1
METRGLEMKLCVCAVQRSVLCCWCPNNHVYPSAGSSSELHNREQGSISWTMLAGLQVANGSECAALLLLAPAGLMLHPQVRMACQTCMYALGMQLLQRGRLKRSLL